MTGHNLSPVNHREIAHTHSGCTPASGGRKDADRRVCVACEEVLRSFRPSAISSETHYESGSGSPAVSFFGVFKEIALAIFGTLTGKVFGGDLESLIVWSDLIAVGPVGAEDYAVRAEEVPEGIQLLPIEALVTDERSISNDRNFRKLDVHMGVARENSEFVMICREVAWVGGKPSVWKMVDDNAEFRDAFDDAEQGGDEARVGISAFENKTCVGKSAKAIEEVRFADVGK